jgi:hypothetical protein
LVERQDRDRRPKPEEKGGAEKKISIETEVQ